MDAAVVNRFAWIRAVVEAGAFARPRRRRSGMAVIKAVAFAVELLMDAEGRPFRWTTVHEISLLSGYDDFRAVRSALAELERSGWLNVTRRAGRAGGLLPCLTVPAEVQEQWAREAEQQERPLV